MKCKVRDKQNYYEVYNDDGDLIAHGTVVAVAEALGSKAETISWAAKTNCKHKGFDIINPAVYRRIFDCYHKNNFVCSGTYEEITAKTGLAEEYIKWASTAYARKKLKETKRSDTNSVVMLEWDHCRLEWLR